MSLTRPASTCWRRPPPPQVWNRSGTSPCWSRVVSLVLNASFSLTWMSIVTLGLAAVYSSASSFHRLRPGSLFWMWYQVIVTGSPAASDGAALVGACAGAVAGAVDGALDAAPPPEQAANTNVAVAARAAIQSSGHRHQSSLLTSLITNSCEIASTSTRFSVAATLRRCATRVRRVNPTTASPSSNPVRREPSRVETFGPRALHSAHDARRSAAAGRNGTTIAVIAREAGVSAPTVSKVINGRSDVAPATRRRVEAVIRRHGYQRPVRPSPSGAAPGAHLPRARERVGAGDRARRRAGRRAPPAGGRPDRDAGPAPARPGLDRGRAGPQADGRDRRLLRPERDHARPAPVARHPVRGRRPGGRAAPRHAVHRRHELERRPDRDPPPARPRPPPDRRHRRAVRRPVQPRPRGRVPGGDGRGRRAGRPEPRQPRPVPGRRGDRRRAGGSSPARTARRRSSPATTSRRSASTRPRARPGCTSRRTSASSASTTCRSPAG